MPYSTVGRRPRPPHWRLADDHAEPGPVPSLQSRRHAACSVYTRHPLVCAFRTHGRTTKLTQLPAPTFPPPATSKLIPPPDPFPTRPRQTNLHLPKATLSTPPPPPRPA
eukprot:scaffold21588_cov135-Isochrysis_galbana.AAC.1